MPEIDTIVREVRAGRVPAGIYSQPDVFELERERLFARTWQYLAHESEIPEPGDYVVRRVLDDSFIVVRDERGELRALLNMCRHRGMQVCRAELGNASHFRCPYHAWTYRNTGELVGVPFHAESYGGDAILDRAEKGLVPAPPPGHVPGHGLRVPGRGRARPPGAPRRVRVLPRPLPAPERGRRRGPGAAALAGAGQLEDRGRELRGRQLPHAAHARQRRGDRAVPEPKASRRKEGALYVAGRGAGTTYRLPTGDLDENLAHLGYPPEMVERMRSAWSPEQRALAGEAGFMVSAGTLFPNLSLVHNWPQVDAAGLVAPFISIRQWQPVGPAETEVLSWFAVDRLAPRWFKEASYRAYLLCFGSSGMFEQDDVENWTSITSVTRGTLARRTLLDSRMGLGPDGEVRTPPVAGWPGPGVARTGFGEYGQRQVLRLWSEYVAGEGG